MNVADVMEHIGARAARIDGLRVNDFPASSITPPAAVIGWPDPLIYDSAHARGLDQITLPLTVAVSRNIDRVAVRRLGMYADGSGPSSVKAAVEAPLPSTGAVPFDTVRVTQCEFDWVMFGEVPYVAAIFTLDIAGKGADQ